MRILLPLCLAGLLAGCATSHEVRTQEGRVQFVVGCSGPLLNFGSCIEKAGAICRGRGYQVLATEGGAMPAAPDAMPQGDLIEELIKREKTPEDFKRVDIRKLYIRCN